MPRSISFAVGVVLWAGALFGSLQLHTLDLPIEHNICGPWGCAAEPQALLGYHLFWLALIAPAIVLATAATPPPWASRLALGAVTLGLAGFLALAVGSALDWVDDGEPVEYAAQRGLFVVATTPDLPFVPLLLGGLAALPLARVGPRTPAEPQRSGGKTPDRAAAH